MGVIFELVLVLGSLGLIFQGEIFQRELFYHLGKQINIVTRNTAARKILDISEQCCNYL